MWTLNGWLGRVPKEREESVGEEKDHCPCQELEDTLLVAKLVEALCYKPGGRRSIPGGVTAIFHSYNPSGRNMALGRTQPLTETSTTNISWG
jgi:hypothetical protein